jgi:hypothetical protein
MSLHVEVLDHEINPPFQWRHLYIVLYLKTCFSKFQVRLRRQPPHSRRQRRARLVGRPRASDRARSRGPNFDAEQARTQLPRRLRSRRLGPRKSDSGDSNRFFSGRQNYGNRLRKGLQRRTGKISTDIKERKAEQ